MESAMHKRRWNALKLELVIEPRAPLLIKSGAASPNPSLPDMQFVRTMTPHGETVFIPALH
jgi:CRISPR-associated protein Csm3